MELNERLRAARAAKGLTQDEVAKHFGISRVSVTQWELVGGTKPGPTRYPDLADLYGVSLDWLMNERGDGPEAAPARSVPTAKTFIKNRAFKFYVEEWRKFMLGDNLKAPAKAAGLDINEYQAHEAYPINFTIGQIMALASEIGVRPEQFFFPPPKVERPVAMTRNPVKKAGRK